MSDNLVVRLTPSETAAVKAGHRAGLFQGKSIAEALLQFAKLVRAEQRGLPISPEWRSEYEIELCRRKQWAG